MEGRSDDFGTDSKQGKIIYTENVCDRRDMQLKEAEKTIANKDVIIKMLQDQVKKLEESYKQNLKETEDFRYRFYLASEQMNRLRGSNAKMKEKSNIADTDIKSEIIKWKNQCDQLIMQECPPNCKYIQQIRNVAKIMKAHYELLQLLGDKISKKSSATDLDPTILENRKKEYNEEISKLQEEIIRLKDENVKIQNQLAMQKKTEDCELVSPNESTSLLPTLKDSLLEAYKRATHELQREVSRIKARSGENLLSDEDDESSLSTSETQLRRVSFSKDKLSTNSKRSDTKNRSSELKLKEQTPIEEEVQHQDNLESTEGFSKVSKVHLTLDNETSSASSDANKISDEKSKDVQVQVSESDIKKYTTTRNNETEENKEDEQTSETNTVKEVTDENNTERTRKPSIIHKEPHQDSFASKKVSVNSMVKLETLEYGAFICEAGADTDSGDVEKVEEETTYSSDSENGRNDKESARISDSVDDYVPNLNDSHFDGSIYTTSISPLDVTLNLADQDDHGSMTNQLSILVMEPELQIITSPEILTQKEDGTKPVIDDGMSQMILKLNDIGDRVAELLQKQGDTCRELESLKSELTVARDSTQACTENISKLAVTIDEQKETFLDKFQEHKTVTDDLIHTNGEIQQELGDLKQKIEILFKNIEDLKREQVLKPLSPVISFSNTDEVITVTEVKGVVPVEYTDTIETIVGASSTPESSLQREVEQEEEIVQTESNQNNLEIDDINQNLEDTCARLEEDGKTKDQRLKCVNSLLSYYKKAQDNLAMINCQDAGSQSSTDKQCKCDNAELQKYIDKVKGQNVKVKTTLNSVIDNIEGKLCNLKSSDEEACPCPGSQKVDCDLNLWSCVLCTSGSNPLDNNIDMQSDLEIEDIYNAVRRTVHPCQADPQSSISCSCTKVNTINTSRECCRDSQSEEDFYNCIVCACGTTHVDIQQSQSESKNPTISSSTEHTDKECVVENCPIGECGFPLNELCNKESLITNLQTYVTYLHEQLDIITSIENRIEDLRVHISDP